MENPKVELKDTGKYGLGLFAAEDIKKGEVIAEFDGRIYQAETALDLPRDSGNPRDHSIQFEEHRFRDSNGVARYINHSCDPNCGIKNLFEIVAMRDIKKGEEITWDYEMSEDSNWRMKCKCGSESCRKIIGAYKNMPESIREKYKGYISDWLVKKYDK